MAGNSSRARFVGSHRRVARHRPAYSANFRTGRVAPPRLSRTAPTIKWIAADATAATRTCPDWNPKATTQAAFSLAWNMTQRRMLCVLPYNQASIIAFPKTPAANDEKSLPYWGTPGMANKGRCHTDHMAPTINAEIDRENDRSNSGCATPRQPSSSRPPPGIISKRYAAKRNHGWAGTGGKPSEPMTSRDAAAVSVMPTGRQIAMTCQRIGMRQRRSL